MNRISKVLAFSFAVLSLSSCNKEGARLFGGNYSFKTSGTVIADVRASLTRMEGTVVEIDTTGMELALVTEQGQMNILRDSGDGMVVTMNVLNGDVRTFRATAGGETLEIEPFRTRVKLNISRLGSVEIPVELSGTATKLDDVVIFDLACRGNSRSELANGSVEIRIADSQLCCVAKEND